MNGKTGKQILKPSRGAKLVFVLSLLTFAALIIAVAFNFCHNFNTSSAGTPFDNVFKSEKVDAETQNLLELRISECDGNLWLLWNKQDNAEYYTVYLNGVPALEQVTDSSLCLDSFLSNGGDYELSVTAYFADGTVITETCRYTHFISLFFIDKPTIIDNFLFWDAVINADHYVVTVNGIPVIQTTSCGVDLFSFICFGGDFEITVTAVGTSEFYLADVSETLSVNVPSLIPPPQNVSVFIFQNSYYLTFYGQNVYVSVASLEDEDIGYVETNGRFLDITGFLKGDGKYILKLKTVENGIESEAVAFELTIMKSVVTLFEI